MLERHFIDPVSKQDCVYDGNVYTVELVTKITTSTRYLGDIASSEIPAMQPGDYWLRYSHDKKEFFFCHDDSGQAALSELLQGVSYQAAKLSYTPCYEPEEGDDPEINKKIVSALFLAYSQNYQISAVSAAPTQVTQKQLDDLRHEMEVRHHRSGFAIGALKAANNKKDTLIEALRKENAALKAKLANDKDKVDAEKRSPSPIRFFSG